MRLLIILIGLIGFTFSSLAQGIAPDNSEENKLILYTQGTPYLSLKIEQYLRELENLDSLAKDGLTKLTAPRTKRVFAKVESLNRLFRLNTFRIKSNDAAVKFDPTQFLEASKEGKDSLKAISESISDYNHILSIQTEELGELVEFQLELFRYSGKQIDSVNNRSYLRLIEPVPIGRSNFFVAPKETDYIENLQNGIRNLFVQANMLPKPIVYINDSIHTLNKTYTIGLSDTLFLDASQSSDIDNRFDQLKFEWSLIEYNHIRPNEAQRIRFSNGSSFQALTFPVLGEYKIGLRIWDGVAFSLEKEVLVRIVKNPVLYIRNRSFYHVKQGTYLNMIFGSKNRVKSYESRGNTGVFYTNSSMKNVNFNISTLKYSRTEMDHLTRVTTSVKRKGRKLVDFNIEESGFSIDSTISLGNGVLRHNFNLDFKEPGAYWVSVYSKFKNVRSKSDTINFNYYYRIPIEFQLLTDRSIIGVGTIGRIPVWAMFFTAKINFIKLLSIDIYLPLIVEKGDYANSFSQTTRLGLSTKFSNSLFKLFGKNLTPGPAPIVDGYLSIFANSVTDGRVFRFRNVTLAEGIAISPHKRLWLRGWILEYFMGFTVNLDQPGGLDGENALLGFQIGMNLGFAILNK